MADQGAQDQEDRARRQVTLAEITARATADQLKVELQQSSPDAEEVRVLYDALEIGVKDLKEAHRDYTTHMTDASEDAIADLVCQRERYAAVCRSAKKWLVKYDIAARIPSSVSSDGSAKVNRIKLPDINLPKFSGDPLKWTSFWDTMKSNIFDTDLSNVDKFNYLRSALIGEASELIAGLPTTSDALDEACALLKREYAKTDKIEAAHFLELLNLKPPTKARGREKLDHKSLRDYKNKVATNVRCLASLNIKPSEYERMALHQFFSQLPPEFKAKWYATVQNRCIDQFIGFLDHQLLSLEPSSPNTPSVVPETSNHKAIKSGVSTASALYSATTSRGREPCALCHKTNHPTSKCNLVIKLPVEQRGTKIKESTLCIKCLKGGHNFKYCPAACQICQGRHHAILCPSKASPPPGAKQDKAVALTTTSTSESDSYQSLHVGVTVAADTQVQTVLQTALIKVLDGQGNFIEANVLFDTGADRSFISSRFIKRIRPKWVRSEPMANNSFGGHKTDTHHNVYQVLLCDLMGSYQQLLAAEIPMVSAPLNRYRVPSELLEQFKGIKWADGYSTRDRLTVDILIGNDYYWRFTPTVPQMERHDGLVAMKTVFGWILGGSWTTTTSSPTDHSTFLLITETTDHELRNFWDLESVGVTSRESHPDPFFHDPHLKTFGETTKKVQDRYEVKLPWKSEQDKGKLVNNFTLAQRRHSRTMAKLEKDPALLEQYDKVFKDYAQQGIIEVVPLEKIATKNPVFYLPHRPIVKEGSTTTKVRPVFDASAKSFNGYSLNDLLITGPSLNPDLVAVLLRFRRWKCALACDIKQAFLQIQISEEDRDVHRFLLEQNGQQTIFRFTRVPFGNTSSPFLLNATIKYHLKFQKRTLVVEELNNNLYVDDWLTGANDLQEADLKFKEAKQILEKAGMTLIKCSKPNLEFSEGTLTEAIINDATKVLGLKWYMDRDCFSFEGLVTHPPTNLVHTKRTVLSLIARLFDPLGFITPYTMTAKIIFQEIWRVGLEWDDPLPTKLQNAFQAWTHSMPHLKNFVVNRCYFPEVWDEISGQVSLHAFCDASERGYGCVVYLRAPGSDGSPHTCRLVISRAKIAPIKRISLPRLELMGALLGARLLEFVRSALFLGDGVKMYAYTDSRVVLHWIKGNASQWKTFVANRVAEIQQIISPKSWHHCPGKDNPADCVTRGMLAQDLVSNKMWLCGPPWLPYQTHIEETNKEDTVNTPLEETRGSAQFVVVSDPRKSIFDLTKWSTFTRAINVVAYTKRFVHNLKSGTKKLTGALATDELQRAKFTLIKEVQSDAYSKEIELLEQGKAILKGSSLNKLDPFLDESGLLRIKGRLENAELSFQSKHPIIIPNGNFARMLTRFLHHQHKHPGSQTLVSILRNEYWVTGARRVAKSVVNRCVACKRNDARLATQPPAPLPKLRVNSAPPFSIVGLDFCGPVYCADFPGKKYYILLITCAVIRALHLEVTSSLKTSDTCLAIQRFIARRGTPSVIYSDNAKTFKAVSEIFKNRLGVYSPEWKFILPLSPWWGGWWERLVRSVKGALKKSLGIQCLTQVELETCLCEVEACINSRPLTFLGSEPDIQEVLTPSKFLIGRTVGQLLEVEDTPYKVSPSDLQEREMIRRQRLDRFWSLWSSEYLRNLPPSVKGFKPNCSIKKGALVLVKEDNLPRLKWPLGVITGVSRQRWPHQKCLSEDGQGCIFETYTTSLRPRNSHLR